MKIIGLRRIILCSMVLLCLCSLAGCSGTSSKQTPAYQAYQAASSEAGQTVDGSSASKGLARVRAKDEVAPGNLVKLTSYQDKNLNGEFRVAFDGELELPYEVTVQAAGLLKGQLKEKILSAYRPYFTATPSIDVKIDAEKRYVDVGGLVKKPGQYLFERDSSLDEVVAKAGGLQTAGSDEEVAARYVKVEQLGAKQLIRLSEYYAGATDIIPEWQGGERLFFQSEGEDATSATAAGKNHVQVLGQVSNPGQYTYEEGADFFFYLSKAGGPTEDANLDKIEIIRANGGGNESIVFKMNKIKAIPAIKGGDIVVLHAEKPSTFISNFSSVIGAMATSVIAAAAL